MAIHSFAGKVQRLDFLQAVADEAEFFHVKSY